MPRIRLEVSVSVNNHNLRVTVNDGRDELIKTRDVEVVTHNYSIRRSITAANAQAHAAS